MSIRSFPKNMRVRFTPNSDMMFFVGRGVDTRQGLDWTVEREDAMFLVKHCPNNFRVILEYPKEDALVSAVLCTCSGRERLARNAVEQFREQTYQNKELVVVNQGEKFLVGDSDPLITEVMVPRGLTNGEMRNIGDGIADGAYIIRFDDDDFWGADRISDQMEAVSETGFPASSYTSYVCYIPEDDEFFQVDMDGICTGLMLYKNEGKKYEVGVVKGTDSIFASKYSGLIVPIKNRPEDYIRIYHGVNLSSKDFILKLYQGDRGKIVRGCRLVADAEAIEKLELAKEKYKKIISS